MSVFSAPLLTVIFGALDVFAMLFFLLVSVLN
uniref:Uncharacterized protein n=1 Tax=Arundo donax TaxID=35708 RepID=A0A0A9AKL8_ARUDO